MVGKALNLKQNICAARIFLNAFGLVLDDIDCLDYSTVINIFLRDTNLVVGTLHFSDDKVLMQAKYNGNDLEASYEMAFVGAISDEEVKGAYLTEWGAKIDFKLKNNTISLDGNVLIPCAYDTEFGIDCSCHSEMKCIFKDGEMHLQINKYGAVLESEIIKDDYEESLLIRPFDDMNGYFRHDIKAGKSKIQRWKSVTEYDYRKYSTIAGSGAEKNKLHVFAFEQRNGEKSSQIDRFDPMLYPDNDKRSMIQKANLMHEIDEDMFTKIGYIRNLLSLGTFSLLDNLVAICFDGFSDKEIKVVFGFDRIKMTYQDGADNLLTSYFGFKNNSPFFSEEMQKKLLTSANK